MAFSVAAGAATGAAGAAAGSCAAPGAANASPAARRIEVNPSMRIVYYHPVREQRRGEAETAPCDMGLYAARGLSQPFLRVVAVRLPQS
ncbi:MAG: hypothetical protein EOP61_37075 [Sphingomonadales bacterium]|nr:MAG: hypothetical protein EOP61_37075 [Sphingomonadales bacterium]